MPAAWCCCAACRPDPVRARTEGPAASRCSTIPDMHSRLAGLAVVAVVTVAWARSGAAAPGFPPAPAHPRRAADWNPMLAALEEAYARDPDDAEIIWYL